MVLVGDPHDDLLNTCSSSCLHNEYSDFFVVLDSILNMDKQIIGIPTFDDVTSPIVHEKSGLLNDIFGVGKCYDNYSVVKANMMNEDINLVDDGSKFSSTLITPKEKLQHIHANVNGPNLNNNNNNISLNSTNAHNVCVGPTLIDIESALAMSTTYNSSDDGNAVESDALNISSNQLIQSIKLVDDTRVLHNVDMLPTFMHRSRVRKNHEVVYRPSIYYGKEGSHDLW